MRVVSRPGARIRLLVFGLILLSTPLAADPISVSAVRADLPDVARGVPRGGALRVSGLALDKHGPVELELERFTVFLPDAKILGLHGESLPVPTNIHFRGRVAGLPDSVAILTVPARGLARGVITDKDRVWMLRGSNGRSAAGLSSRKVSADELDSLPPFQCGVEALTGGGALDIDPAMAIWPGVGAVETAPLPAGVTHTARVAVETDYEYFSLFGSETAALDYMGDLFAYASTLYEREVNTNLVISYARLWPGGADTDPWTVTRGTDTALYEFREYWNANMASEDRTIAHMLSGKPLGGGIAFVGVLCNQSVGYGLSASLSGGFDIANPRVVTDLLLVTHEIGHNFNSRHTHDYCGVEDVADPVDLCFTSNSCGSAMGLPGLDSLSGGTTVEKPGTIMSYCHLVSGGYSNLSFTFGLEHPYGVAAHRVPSVMQSHVQGTASAFPACLSLVSEASLLSVQVAGTGSGVVTSTPAGIDCGTTCSAGFSTDTEVTLSAEADPGSQFTGFGGDCAVDGSVLMVGDKTCTATFDLACGNGDPCGAKVYTVSPCRIVDTRNADPFVSTFSGDRLAPGETVPFFVTGSLIDGQGGAADCGVPDTASGVFANVVAVRPQGSAISNYLTVYPYGESRPLASTVNYPVDITALANGVLVPLCDPALATCAYDLNVYNNTTLAVHLVIDVTGYLAVPAPAP